MKSQFSSSSKRYTEVEIIRKVPKGIYTTKHHEALGKIWAKLAYDYDLISIKEEEPLLKNGFYNYKFIVTLKRIPVHTSSISATVEAIFEFQDWGEKTQDEL